MLAQRPASNIIDKRAQAQDWIAHRRPLTLIGPFTSDQIQWFIRDYVTLSKQHFADRGYQYNHEIAAVLVVFSRSPNYTD